MTEEDLRIEQVECLRKMYLHLQTYESQLLIDQSAEKKQVANLLGEFASVFPFGLPEREWNLELTINVVVKARNENQVRDMFYDLDYEITHPKIVDSEILKYSVESGRVN